MPAFLHSSRTPFLLTLELLIGEKCLGRMLKCDVCLHRGNVGDIIEEKDARGVKEMLLRDLDLEQVQNPLQLALSKGAGAMKYQNFSGAMGSFRRFFSCHHLVIPGSCLAGNQACTLLRRALLKKLFCMPLFGPFYSMLTGPAKPTFQKMDIPSLRSGSTYKSLLPGAACCLGPMWGLLHLDTTYGKLPEV